MTYRDWTKEDIDRHMAALRPKIARERNLSMLGEAFLKSLSKWDELCARGMISTPDERIRVMGDTIREARALGLLPVVGTDQAHDEDQDARATGPSFEQERRCRELDEESGP